MWQEVGGLSGYKSNITNILLTQTQRAMSITFFRVQQCTPGSNTPDEYAAKQKKRLHRGRGIFSPMCSIFVIKYSTYKKFNM